MEKEEMNQRAFKPPETDLFLQWGNKKRLRCVRVRDPEVSNPSNGGRIRRKITSPFLTVPEKEGSLLHPTARLTRNLEAATLRSENQKSAAASPEEERFYTTRGSVAGSDEYVNGGGAGGGDESKDRRVVWPKLFISLSSKEKEEDFMAMKGCKPPQRPKKRAKVIQRTLLLVSPGAWLTDMCQERYEVREKKSSKKRPRGLKAMGSSMDSDSE